MRSTYKLIICLLILNGIAPFISSAQARLREGDLLFQTNACGPLCESINKVTEGYKGFDFNHCALVIKVKNSLQAIEAIGEDVHLISIEKFYERSKGINPIVVGRLRPSYQHALKDISTRALSYLNTAYDPYYELDNGKLYCSELIYELFKSSDNGEPIFPLAPMTFKDPVTKEIFDGWKIYYQSLNHPIPEGKPGINPGGLSLSDKISIVEVGMK
ncbi:hypothetical protein BH10BAC4_BH10BAC4_11590 [soil metagenome]